MQNVKTGEKISQEHSKRLTFSESVPRTATTTDRLWWSIAI